MPLWLQILLAVAIFALFIVCAIYWPEKNRDDGDAT